MVALSRKRFVGKSSSQPIYPMTLPIEMLLVWFAGLFAVQQRAYILRTHNVAATKAGLAMCKRPNRQKLYKNLKIHEFNAQQQGFIMSDNQPEPTLEQRKVIYRARRGLKNLIIIDPYGRERTIYKPTHESSKFCRIGERRRS